MTSGGASLAAMQLLRRTGVNPTCTTHGTKLASWQASPG
jgi:hypothetical protein